MITYDDTTIKENHSVAELILDTGSVCLSLERFEELVAAETKLAIVHEAYIRQKSWEIESTLSLIFPATPRQVESDGGSDVK